MIYFRTRKSMHGKAIHALSLRVYQSVLYHPIVTVTYSDGMAGHAFSHSADSRSAGKPAPAPAEPPSLLTGSLLIDVIDAASQKLVWRGTAAGEVDPGLTSKQRDERTKAIVQSILSHFPPK